MAKAYASPQGPGWFLLFRRYYRGAGSVTRYGGGSDDETMILLMTLLEV